MPISEVAAWMSAAIPVSTPWDWAIWVNGTQMMTKAWVMTKTRKIGTRGTTDSFNSPEIEEYQDDDADYRKFELIGKQRLGKEGEEASAPLATDRAMVNT